MVESGNSDSQPHTLFAAIGKLPPPHKWVYAHSSPRPYDVTPLSGNHLLCHFVTDY